MLQRKQLKQQEESQLIRIVEQVRLDHPRMSARSIYKKVNPTTFGRDHFERICYDNGLRVRKKKNFRKTTNSLGVTRFENLIQHKKVTAVNQVFVSDITYYELKNKFYYITLIMDLFNREIVGYSLSDNLLTSATTIPALESMIRRRGSENLEGAIFHSDGGGQYYSKEFRKITWKLKMKNSMAEDVYENPHAERLNGIIKNNYLYPYGPENEKQLKAKLRKAIWMYNHEKPHQALNGKTPINYLNSNNKKVNAI